MTTSRDEALKLALEIVHGDEPYPTGNSPHTRLSCAKILARELIESESENMKLHAVLFEAMRVDAANAKRASAQVQDMTVRVDYENAMGGALDGLRRAIDAALRREEVRDG